MRRLLSTMTSLNPRRFAPLKEASGLSSKAPRLQGVVFDVDGTLCEPQTYMFAQMRAALSITKATDILDHVYSLPTEAARSDAMEAIRAIEREAMASQVAQPGLVELMTYLDARGVRKGICTRNFDTPVAHLLGKFLPESHFSPIVTRDFRPPKPHPAGILHIASSWGLTEQGGGEVDGNGVKDGEGGRQQTNGEDQVTVLDLDAEQQQENGIGTRKGDASHLIMVGDSIDDMTAGRRAGAATVLLVNDVNSHLAEHEHTDLVIRQLDELISILEEGFKSRHL